MEKCYCGNEIETGRTACVDVACHEKYMDNYKKSQAPFFPSYFIIFAGLVLMVGFSIIGVLTASVDDTTGVLISIGGVIAVIGRVIVYSKERVLRKMYL